MENLDLWRKAGKIASEALDYGVSLIQNGANIREVCDKVDQKVIELGAKPAWPAQVALDSVAAHFTPDHDDDAVFDNHVVCMDIGAHIDGCVGDNASTVDLSGKHEQLINAAKAALGEAQKALRPGVELCEIGRVIERAIKQHGAIPVKNLSGHGINPWEIHDWPSVPNFDNGDDTELEEGMVIAIEPFATNGLGFVDEAEQGNIFSLVHKKPVRSPFARDLLKFIEKEYGPLPFAHRWLVGKFGLGKTNLGLRELMRVGALHSHPPLVEKGGGIVAQFENTFLITKNGCEVLTKHT